MQKYTIKTLEENIPKYWLWVTLSGGIKNYSLFSSFTLYIKIFSFNKYNFGKRYIAMEINVSPLQLKQEFPCNKSSNCSRIRGTVINQSSWNTHPTRQLGACQEIQEAKYEQVLKWNHEEESSVKSCCSYYICGSSAKHPVGLLLVLREAFGKMSYTCSWDIHVHGEEKAEDKQGPARPSYVLHCL